MTFTITLDELAGGWRWEVRTRSLSWSGVVATYERALAAASERLVRIGEAINQEEAQHGR